MYKQSIEVFQEKFYQYRDKKIVLYGIGGCTKALLDEVKGQYRFIGLLDRDESLIGQTRYDIPIVDRAIAETADFVVISTLESYWKVIYNRIRDWNVPIYTMDGRLAKDLFKENDRDNDVYWEKTKDAMMVEIERHDVISFDIFDTLIMRKVYDPRDVLLLVEERVKKELGEDFAYLNFRNQALVSLDNPTIDEIFNEIQRITGWTRGCINQIKNIEIDVDRKLMVPRTDIVEVYREISVSKSVYIVSDMYYPTELLLEILSDLGVGVDRERLIVSCDIKKSKADASMWQWYKERFVGNKKALHIGDNKKADVENARMNGIDAYRVLSAAEMLEKSSFAACISEVKTLEASLYLGILLNNLFNSPFSLCETRGKVDLRSDKQAGYCLYGGLIYTFTMWLIEHVKRHQVEQLLFVARDGFFLIRAYEYICKLLEEKDIPESLYLETSKRALLPFVIRDEADIREELKKRVFIGTTKQLLKNRFGIVSECTQEALFENSDREVESIIDLYGKEILLHLREYRIAYKKYLDGMNIRKRVAMVDVGFSGEIQSILSGLLGDNLKGYYFAGDLRMENPNYKNNMYGCFQSENDKAAKDVEVRKKYLYIESFFTAPNGSLRYVTGDGAMVYGDKMSNQRCFDIRYDMFEGALDLVEDILETYQGIGHDFYKSDKRFVDKMFGIMLDGGFEMSNRMKDSFFEDDIITKSSERALW